MSKAATIKDVAKLADVSISTVSRVLNKSAPVAENLALRVYKAMNELNYSPNEIARSLKSSNAKMIASVVSNTDDHYFTAINRGIEQTIAKHGYSLVVCSTYFDRNNECRHLSEIIDRRMSGVVLNTVGNNDEFVAKMSNTMPMVLCSRKINSPDFVGDFADFDSTSAMYQLTKHIIALGHRDIAVIRGPEYLSTASERFQGFADAMEEIGIDVTHGYPFDVQPCDCYAKEDGYICAQRIMNAKKRPTAIISTNGMAALGAMSYFKEHNISIPDDVSFCCFDSIVNSELMYIQPTHIETDRVALGVRIGSLMIDRINGNYINTNKEVRLPTRLVIGNSTKKI